MSIPIFTNTKVLNASKEVVFQAFASAEALEQWWGPVEAPISVLKFDFRVGGEFHYRMNGDMVYYGLFHYREISAPKRLDWVNSFANERGEIIKAPFEGFDFPLEVINVLTLNEQNGVTTLTITSEPINATASEIATFDAIRDNMTQGFSGTFNQLESYISR
jgi:uncharacterized protein YndB with AHSA1/START domain